jgi:uncharacterized membrane protein YfcA
MPWYEAAGLIVFGFFVGTYGAMVGVGGGFLIVPLLLALGSPARVAAGTSIVVVLANAASSTVSYLRQKRVDLRSGLIFSAAGIPGAILGAWADQHLSHRLFTVLFGLLLVAVAIRAVLTKNDAPAAATPSEDQDALEHQTRDFVDAMGVRHQYGFNIWAAIGVSAFTGFLASMFGIGGGVVQVPAMVYLFQFPTHVAVATSQLIIFITAIFGAAAHAYYGDILPLPALFLSIGAIAGAQLGARLATRMHPGPLMRWFSLAVAAAALYLIFRR